MRVISLHCTRISTRNVAPQLMASAAILAVALGSASPANAQTTAVQPEAITPSGVADIVVTAQKRAQNLQDVPIAVTAVTTDSLVANRVQDVADLNSLAPGLLIRRSPGGLGSPTVALRGVSASPSAGAQDRQIALYIDGVSVGSNRGVLTDLPDIERVEILRGPQGTLFGRNSTAGAISIVTRDPSGVLSLRQEVTLGNYDQFRSRTTFETPKFGPFSAYATYVHDERRGDVRNLGAGATFDRTNPFFKYGVTSSPEFLGSKNSNDVFVAFKFQPTDNFRTVYKYNYTSSTVSSDARVGIIVNPRSLTGNLINQILAAQPPGGGRYGAVQLYPGNERPDAISNPFDQPIPLTSEGHNFTTTWDVGGGFSFKNVTGWREARVEAVADVAGPDGLELTAAAVPAYARFVALSTVPGFSTMPAANQAAVIANISTGLQPSIGRLFVILGGQSLGASRQFSTEFQVNYDSKDVTVTAGALYYRAAQSDGGLPGFPNTISFSALNPQVPLGNVSATLSKVRSFAAYIQAEFHLTPQIDLVTGARLTRDEKDGQLVSGGAFSGTRTEGVLVNTLTTPYEYKDTKPNYSIGINYKPNNNLLIYGKYATGFISGGATGPFPFDAETVKSIEVGIKADLFDRRVRANLALYNADYLHVQSAAPGSNFFVNGVAQSQLGAVVIDNGPLETRGVEFELTAVPLEGLTLTGSVAYNYSKLTSPNPLVALGRPYQLSGVSPWVGSASAQYDTPPLFDDAKLTFRLDANYQGEYRAISFTDIATVIPEFAPYEFTKAILTLNARVALRSFKIGRLDGEIALWSRNLTDGRAGTFPFQLSDAVIVNSFQPARTFGIDFIAKFR